MKDVPDGAKAATGGRAESRMAFERRLMEAARHQLATVGAAGIGMRALAKSLDVTPGALYRYVASRDALLTALILEAFTSLGDAARAAEEALPRHDLEGRWLAVWRAVRSWSLAHRHEYALIYGTPVPGYRAPTDTIQPASVVTLLLVGIAWDVLARSGSRNTWKAPAGLDQDMAQIRAWLEQQGINGDVPDEIIMRVLRARTELFGSVTFELFGQNSGSIHHGEVYLDEVARRSFAVLRSA